MRQLMSIMHSAAAHTAFMLVAVVGVWCWGWHNLRDHAPGIVRLGYWIVLLMCLHLVVSH